MGIGRQRQDQYKHGQKDMWVHTTEKIPLVNDGPSRDSWSPKQHLA